MMHWHNLRRGRKHWPRLQRDSSRRCEADIKCLLQETGEVPLRHNILPQNWWAVLSANVQPMQFTLSPLIPRYLLLWRTIMGMLKSLLARCRDWVSQVIYYCFSAPVASPKTL